MVPTPSTTCTYNKGFEIRETLKKQHSIYINYLKPDVNVKESRWPWYLQHPFPLTAPSSSQPHKNLSPTLLRNFFLLKTNVHLFHWMIFFWYLLITWPEGSDLEKTRANKGTKSDPQPWPKPPFHCNLSDWEGVDIAVVLFLKCYLIKLVKSKWGNIQITLNK